MATATTEPGSPKLPIRRNIRAPVRGGCRQRGDAPADCRRRRDQPRPRARGGAAARARARDRARRRGPCGGPCRASDGSLWPDPGARGWLRRRRGKLRARCSGSAHDSALLVLAGLAGVGISNGATLLARTAGGDMYPPERRARGIALVLFGAVFGAILGPLVFGPVLAGRDLDGDSRRDRRGRLGWVLPVGPHQLARAGQGGRRHPGHTGGDRDRHRADPLRPDGHAAGAAPARQGRTGDRGSRPAQRRPADAGGRARQRRLRKRVLDHRRGARRPPSGPDARRGTRDPQGGLVRRACSPPRRALHGRRDALPARPVQRPGVPVWVAGYSGMPKPMRRAARYDGFSRSTSTARASWRRSSPASARSARRRGGLPTRHTR